jgi:hypothetical protein
LINIVLERMFENRFFRRIFGVKVEEIKDTGALCPWAMKLTTSLHIMPM